MIRRLSLRVTVPAIVLLLGAFLATVSLLFELTTSARRSEEDALERARTLGTLVADGIESAFHYGDDAEARSRLSHATADRSVRSAVLFDEKDRVLFATRFQLEGGGAAATPFRDVAERFPALRATLQGAIVRQGDRLMTLYPVLLRGPAGDVVSTRVGILAVEHDLGPARARARRDALVRSLAFAACLLAACLLTWVVIHRRVTRRVESLVSATRLVAEGGEAPAPLPGGDEIAELSAALHRMGRDLTGRRELEERLRQAQKMEAIGRLAGGVAHDFNNLLTAILGFGEVLRAKLDPGDPDAVSEVDEILSAGRRAASLTRQLLAFGRKQILSPEDLHLNALASDMANMLRRLIGEDVELTLDLGEDVPLVRADRGQIEQVVVNLVVNARDALPQGGRVTVRTERAPHAPTPLPGEEPLAGPLALLTVTDDGIGMDEATRARVFEPFFTTKDVGRGTGLGLATSYGVVTQSGGAVRVESEPGKGTTFRVYLPAVEAPDAN